MDHQVVVQRSIVTLLTIGSIDDTITTIRETTVQTTNIGDRVCVFQSSITLLQGVNNTITTIREFTVETAGIGNVGIGSTKIALFPSVGLKVSVTTLATAVGVTAITGNVVTVITRLTSIEGVITTAGQLTVGTTGIWNRVGVINPIITHLTGIDDTITAIRSLAIGSAAVRRVGVVATLITLLGGGVGETASALLLASGITPPVTDGSYNITSG